MTVQDAKGILSGGDTAATEYFRRTTQDALRKRFLPIVQAGHRAGRAWRQKYNEYADTAAAFGLVKKEDANLDDYVTQKALDGLFFMVAEEEKKIRKDPARRRLGDHPQGLRRDPVEIRPAAIKLALTLAIIAAGLLGRSAVDKVLALRGGGEAVALWAQLSSVVDLVAGIALAGIGGGLTVLVAQAAEPERRRDLLRQALAIGLAAVDRAGARGAGRRACCSTPACRG